MGQALDQVNVLRADWIMPQDPVPKLPGPERPPPSAVVGSREEPGFDLLFRRYAPYVGSIALGILGRQEEAEEVVQEVFVLAHAHLGQLRDPAAVAGWLGKIAVRRARRHLGRAWWRRVMRTAEPLEYERLLDPTSSPEDRAHVASVYRLLARLPADERVVWVLRHVQEQRLEEIAELVGCSLSTVQRRLRRAQAAMEEVLSHG